MKKIMKIKVINYEDRKYYTDNKQELYIDGELYESFQDLNDCPEDCILSRDLKSSDDYISFLDFYIKGEYTGYEVEYLEKDISEYK